MSSKNTENRQSPTLLQDQSSSDYQEFSLLSSVEESSEPQHAKKTKPIAILAVSGLLASGIVGLFLMQKNTQNASPTQATTDTKKVSSLALGAQQQVLTSPSTPEIVAKQTLQSQIVNSDLSNNISTSSGVQLENRQPQTMPSSAKIDKAQPAKEIHKTAQGEGLIQASVKTKELALKNNIPSVKKEQKKRTDIQTTRHHESAKKQKKQEAHALLVAKAKIPTKRQQAKTSSSTTQPLLDDTEMRLLRVMLGNDNTKESKR